MAHQKCHRPVSIRALVMHAWRYRLKDGAEGTLISPYSETIEDATDELRVVYRDRLETVTPYSEADSVAYEDRAAGDRSARI